MDSHTIEIRNSGTEALTEHVVILLIIDLTFCASAGEIPAIYTNALTNSCLVPWTPAIIKRPFTIEIHDFAITALTDVVTVPSPPAKV